MFEEDAEIVEYDKAIHEKYPEQELATCDFAVVCVGTPMGEDGSCDVSYVEDAIRRLPVDRILIKSTVVPGTTDRLVSETGKLICFSPEYIRETTYFHPFWDRGAAAIPFLIVGGSPDARRAIIDDVISILGPEKTYFQCTAIEAEVIKYMENSYLATKVTFVNEFYEICKAFDADWHTVREGWLLDPRVDRSHTLVFPKERGFGGRCLPKDVNAIVKASLAAGYRPELLQAILDSNRRIGGESGPEG
jgi:nucleotide sugar dehydrogenase